MESLDKKQLRNYLEAEKQEIIQEYGKLTEETIRDFIEKKGAEKFHKQYFKLKKN